MSGDRQGLLQVDGLTKTFGGLVAVDDLSFTVIEGEILGLLGPNGSGKTTVFNLIAGALRPDAGRVSFSGLDITRHSPSVRTRLGIARTFQLVRPLPHLSAFDNVLVAQLYGRGGAPSFAEARTESQRLLDLIDLAEKATYTAAQLTLAERKRLEIARALGTHPLVLLLDEPLSGLNAAEVERALVLFRRIQADGVTLVIVEHNVRAVLALCGRVVVLNSGRRIAEGRPDEALARPDVVEVYLGKGSAFTGGATTPTGSVSSV